MDSKQPQAKILYSFPDRTFIENITIRPNGHLLLTTFRDGSLYDLDPSSSKPEPQLVAQLPEASSLTGIVQIDSDVYAVTGGHQPAPMRFDQETLKCFRVDLREGIEHVKVDKITNVLGPQLLNGMAGIPENPHILLSLDSIDGSVVRINTKSGKVDVPIRDVLLKPSEDSSKVPLGANGAKIRDGYLYFTNSAREIFGKVKIDAEGNQEGEVEILVSEETGPYDDFDFGRDGVAYLTRHSDAVFRVTPENKQELFVGGNGDDSVLKSPTSLAVSDDGRKMYVACGGKVGEFVGFIVEVDL